VELSGLTEDDAQDRKTWRNNEKKGRALINWT